VSGTFLQTRGAQAMTRYRSDFLDTAETAQILRLKKHTMENMRYIGNGPIFYKIGGRVFYRRADLRRWLAQARRRSTSGERP
jgi:Helix-turn-helix domain